MLRSFQDFSTSSETTTTPGWHSAPHGGMASTHGCRCMSVRVFCVLHDARDNRPRTTTCTTTLGSKREARGPTIAAGEPGEDEYCFTTITNVHLYDATTFVASIHDFGFIVFPRGLVRSTSRRTDIAFGNFVLIVFHHAVCGHCSFLYGLCRPYIMIRYLDTFFLFPLPMHLSFDAYYIYRT